MNNTIPFHSAPHAPQITVDVNILSMLKQAASCLTEMVSENVYLAAIGPDMELTIIVEEDAPSILPCFDEDDALIAVKGAPLFISYNPAQVLKLAGKRYLTGPVIFYRTDGHSTIVSLTVEDRRIGGLIAIIPKDWKYLRGDIYYADMETHIGSEQGGTRPVVVLQNDVGNRYAPTLIVATVTSRTEKKKYQPTHVLIAHNTAFEKPSVVQLEQIFTIDKSRIQRFLGQTTRHEMRRIEEALMNSLEINEWDRRNADE